MIGAGTFINPLIKIVTTVAILAAAYFFIVKPTLDTTEKAFDSVSPVFESIDVLPNDVQRQVQQSVREAERVQRQQARASEQQIRQADRLISCIQRAEGDVGAITTCNKRYGSS